MEKIRTILTDDEPEALNIIKELLKDHKEIEVVAEANSVDGALVKILEFNPDLIFLDIEMPGKNGFDLIKLLRKNNIQMKVVFVTAFNQFAIDAIKVSAFDYLLKPVGKAELSACIERYKSLNGHRQEENYGALLDLTDIKSRLKFNTRSGFTLISKKNISHCIADSNYTVIYHSHGRKEVVSMTLGKVEKELDDKRFYRIGRSCIINLDFIDRIDRKQKQCVLTAGDEQYIIDIPAKYIKKIENIL